MCDTADQLGLSDLNVDDDDDRAAQAQQGSSSPTGESTDGFLKGPERQKPLRRSIKVALSPEQTAVFRLKAVANNYLAVLADLKTASEMEGAGERSLLSSYFSTTTSFLDCLAFGYLALMLVPDVPRPWLKDLVRRRHESLALFVDAMHDAVFGGDVFSSLPWADPLSSRLSGQQPSALTRFARGVVAASVPRSWELSLLNLPKEQSSPRSTARQCCIRK